MMRALRLTRSMLSMWKPHSCSLFLTLGSSPSQSADEYKGKEHFRLRAARRSRTCPSGTVTWPAEPSEHMTTSSSKVAADIARRMLMPPPVTVTSKVDMLSRNAIEELLVEEGSA